MRGVRALIGKSRTAQARQADPEHIGVSGGSGLGGEGIQGTKRGAWRSLKASKLSPFTSKLRGKQSAQTEVISFDESLGVMPAEEPAALGGLETFQRGADVRNGIPDQKSNRHGSQTPRTPRSGVSANSLVARSSRAERTIGTPGDVPMSPRLAHYAMPSAAPDTQPLYQERPISCRTTSSETRSARNGNSRFPLPFAAPHGQVETPKQNQARTPVGSSTGCSVTYEAAPSLNVPPTPDMQARPCFSARASSADMRSARSPSNASQRRPLDAGTALSDNSSVRLSRTPSSLNASPMPNEQLWYQKRINSCRTSSAETRSTRSSSNACPGMPLDTGQMQDWGFAMAPGGSSPGISRTASSFNSLLTSQGRIGGSERSSQPQRGDAERQAEVLTFSDVGATPLRMTPGTPAQNRPMRSQSVRSSCKAEATRGQQGASGNSSQLVQTEAREQAPLHGRALFMHRHFNQPPSAATLTYAHTQLHREGQYTLQRTPYREFRPQWTLAKE